MSRGASLRETGSRASTEPASSLGPTGFDPARVTPAMLKVGWQAGKVNNGLPQFDLRAAYVAMRELEA